MKAQLWLWSPKRKGNHYAQPNQKILGIIAEESTLLIWTRSNQPTCRSDRCVASLYAAPTFSQVLSTITYSRVKRSTKKITSPVETQLKDYQAKLLLFFHSVSTYLHRVEMSDFLLKNYDVLRHVAFWCFLVCFWFLLFSSASGHPTDPSDEQDPCTVWQNCALNQLLKASRWFQKLPSCSCQLQPAHFIYNNTIYDPALNKSFQWRGMKVDKKGLLRRTAEFCIRSLPRTSLSAQVCCYDSKFQLITRGTGAGAPFVVSPDRNASMHYKLDVLPIRLCNGDWTRYHAVRPPNNGRNCSANPDDNEFALQVLKARDY